MAEAREGQSGCLAWRRGDDEGEKSLSTADEKSTSGLNATLGGESVKKDEVGGPGGAELGAGGERSSAREGGGQESLGSRMKIRDAVNRGFAEEGVEEGKAGGVIEEGEEGGAGFQTRRERDVLQQTWSAHKNKRLPHMYTHLERLF